MVEETGFNMLSGPYQRVLNYSISGNNEYEDFSHSVSSKIPRRTRKRYKKPTVFICTTFCRFNLVRNTARHFNLGEVSEFNDWNVYWTDIVPSLERCKNMKSHQRINHFPGMIDLCRKDVMAKCLNKMLKKFPELYDFFPRTWCLPEEASKMLAYARENPGQVFILKPTRGSEGRGISITRSAKNLKTTSGGNLIGQVYVSKPLLIDGFKFDFRLYALVTACDPLRVFVYNEGLARFATRKYEITKNNLNNRFVHLTNYSVNRWSSDFIVDDEEGSKRRLSTINDLLSKMDIDVKEIWESIDDVIIKTLITALPKLKYYYHLCFENHTTSQACFEILGFDFILDHKLKPYLLEINHTPSFNRHTPTDRKVKDALLHDVFELLNLSRSERPKSPQLEGKWSNISTGRVKGPSKERKMDKIFKWENDHLGNFRKIYPCSRPETYKPFLKIKRNFTPKTISPELPRPVFPDSPPPTCSENVIFSIEGQQVTAENPRQNPYTFEPTLTDKLDGKSFRNFLLLSHSVMSSVDNKLRQARIKWLQDEIKLTRSNDWNFKNNVNALYETHRQGFTESVKNMLYCISQKTDLPWSGKERLSSIFLNPTTRTGDGESHLGSFFRVENKNRENEKGRMKRSISDENMNVFEDGMSLNDETPDELLKNFFHYVWCH